MGRFVLVDDEQVPVSPSDAAQAVENMGFKMAAQSWAMSESTLRNFLKRNGYVARTSTVLDHVAVTEVTGAAEGDAVTQS